MIDGSGGGHMCYECRIQWAMLDLSQNNDYESTTHRLICVHWLRPLRVRPLPSIGITCGLSIKIYIKMLSLRFIFYFTYILLQCCEEMVSYSLPRITSS